MDRIHYLKDYPEAIELIFAVRRGLHLLVLAVWKLLDKFREHIDLAKRRDYLLVVFDLAWHRWLGSDEAWSDRP